jgi:CheY-like chemotaxis protein
MDGFELIARVRRSDDATVREIPAAALTAYARSEDRAKTLQSGFEMHLAKPIDPVELASAVKALSRRRSR